MVLADKTLFVAGPPDVIDEAKAFGRFAKPEVHAKLVEQAAAFKGEKGGLLWVVSAENGKKLTEYELDFPPVFHGMVKPVRQFLYIGSCEAHGVIPPLFRVSKMVKAKEEVI